ncbi:MAG: helix-turn-helix domain-containing protein [Candidatus Xenobia bacterium]
MNAIHNDNEHAQAVEELNRLLGDNSREARNQAEVLVILIEDYEKRHHALEAPNPIEALKNIMEWRGLEPKDLEPYIGSRSHVSEVLNGRRDLSKEMIRRLVAWLKIPADILLGTADAVIIRPPKPKSVAKPKPRPGTIGRGTIGRGLMAARKGASKKAKPFDAPESTNKPAKIRQPQNLKPGDKVRPVNVGELQAATRQARGEAVRGKTASAGVFYKKAPKKKGSKA